MRLRRLGMVAAMVMAACGVVYAAYEAAGVKATPLAAYAPPGAMLAIESPDFAGLLKSWTGSAEQTRWLKSANYAGFANSRLFGRLSAAQDEFAGVAGLSADTKFLQQVAGKESLFAWYDIGNLEFLYITRMPAGQAAKVPLLALKDKFEERRVGDAVFYVKTGSDKDRTVAFAVRGDMLLLATREDLLAGALQLMMTPGDRTLEHESWYASTVKLAGKQGDLRMTLNLAKIVPSPQFRTYWVQQNITAMKPYTAAESDLYREAGSYREERVLVAADPEKVAADADLSAVTAYVPADAGVYRATANPSTDDVVAQMEDKLLTRQASAYRDPRVAPVAELSTPEAGDADEFEQRIDAPLVVAELRSADVAKLRELVGTQGVTAMMAFSTAQGEAAEGVFRPVRTAVVLQAAQPWDLMAMETALSAALARRVSVSDAGLAWVQGEDAGWVKLNGMDGMAMAVHGTECVMASDAGTLEQLLAAQGKAAKAAVMATAVAGFSLKGEREPMERLVDVLDQASEAASSRPEGTEPGDGVVPPFFSGTMQSLSETFRDFDGETFTQSTGADRVVRQSVLYQWRR
jgi:hypothetical protein